MTAIDSTRLLAMRTAILEQNSALQRAAGAGGPGGIAGNADAKGAAGFGDALQSALAEVNALQAQSSAATTAYEKGETTALAAVMLARQQDSIAVEATTQVRNNPLSPTKNIIHMTV